MEDTASKIPFFKKIDQAIFDRINKFKQTSNYNQIQDFYNGLDEEQQKVFKGASILSLFALPLLFLSLLWWQNGKLKNDLDLRKKIVARANEILGKKQGLQEVKFNVISDSPIDSDSMMTTRLSSLLSSSGVELSKIQVREFNSSSVSTDVLRSEADFSFNNVSTDELMNIFIAMIQREKFRISEVSIKRNADSNLLTGKFHAIHFSNIVAGGEEE
jgi:hypothetical protein